MSAYLRMGDWFVQRGILSPVQLERAVELQRESRRRFGEILVSSGLVSEEDVVGCLSDQYDMPVADFTSFEPQEEALALVPSHFALSHLLLPVRIDESVFECVMSDPVDLPVVDELRQALKRRLSVSLATPTALYTQITKAYRVTGAPKLELFKQSERPRPPRRKSVKAQVDRQQLLEELKEAM